mgnify:CR=1 FL=1
MSKISEMIANHDPELYENKTTKTGASKPLRTVGLKLTEKELLEEVAIDLNLPVDVVNLVGYQLVRRIVYHMLHDHELVLNHFGRFRLKRGHKHWVIQFLRMRTLDSYINARLDNDQNTTEIKRLNPVITKSWYDRQILQGKNIKLKKIRSVD